MDNAIKSQNLNMLIRNVITDNDIIMNNVATIPKKLLKIIRSGDVVDGDVVDGDVVDNDYDDLMLEYFYKELKYNIVGAHFTRLFDYEIDDMIHTGINSDETDNYIAKINNLPNCFNAHKSKLINYVSNPCNKRSHGKIYFDVGNICVDYDNEVFLRNWGGETLYCYYDNSNISKSKRLLGEKLNRLSCPCMAIIRVNAYTFFTEFPYTHYWVEQIKEYNITKYSKSHCINSDDVNLIDIIKI